MIEDEEETRRWRERQDRRWRWQGAILFAIVTWLYVCAKDIGGWLRGEDGAETGILIGSILVFGVVGAGYAVLEFTSRSSDLLTRRNRR